MIFQILTAMAIRITVFCCRPAHYIAIEVSEEYATKITVHVPEEGANRIFRIY
jgi:hypothetical protein